MREFIKIIERYTFLKNSIQILENLEIQNKIKDVYKSIKNN